MIKHNRHDDDRSQTETSSSQNKQLMNYASKLFHSQTVYICSLTPMNSLYYTIQSSYQMANVQTLSPLLAEY